MIKIFLLTFICGMIHSEEAAKADVVKNIGKYRLEITYLLKGTKSEGMTGKLFTNDSEVIGKEGDVIKVDSVVIRHYGDDRKLRWSTTGWNLDPQIKHSYQKE